MYITDCSRYLLRCRPTKISKSFWIWINSAVFVSCNLRTVLSSFSSLSVLNSEFLDSRTCNFRIWCLLFFESSNLLAKSSSFCLQLKNHSFYSCRLRKLRMSFWYLEMTISKFEPSRILESLRVLISFLVKYLFFWFSCSCFWTKNKPNFCWLTLPNNSALDSTIFNAEFRSAGFSRFFFILETRTLILQFSVCLRLSWGFKTWLIWYFSRLARWFSNDQ